MKLEWNTGGWFGGQLGGTAWILVAGALTAIRDPSAGLVVLAIFLAANIIGYLLWRSRKFSCYASFQLLIVVIGIAGLLVIWSLESTGQWSEIQHGGEVSANNSYFMIITVVAILMAVFYVRFGRKSNA